MGNALLVQQVAASDGTAYGAATTTMVLTHNGYAQGTVSNVDNSPAFVAYYIPTSGAYYSTFATGAILTPSNPQIYGMMVGATTGNDTIFETSVAARFTYTASSKSCTIIGPISSQCTSNGVGLVVWPA